MKTSKSSRGCAANLNRYPGDCRPPVFGGQRPIVHKLKALGLTGGYLFHKNNRITRKQRSPQSPGNVNQEIMSWGERKHSLQRSKKAAAGDSKPHQLCTFQGRTFF